MNGFTLVAARFLSAVLMGVVLLVPVSGAAQSELASAQAAEFMGNWTLTLQSDTGPMALSIEIRDADGRVAVEVGSDMGRDEVTNVTRAEEALVLRFNTDAQGQAIDVVINLRPDGETLRAAVTAGGGVFSANGTASRAQ